MDRKTTTDKKLDQQDTGGGCQLARRRAMTQSMKYVLFGLGATVTAGAGLLSPRNAHAGFANCYKCNCRAFEGSTYQCANCGHQYADHY